MIVWAINIHLFGIPRSGVLLQHVTSLRSVPVVIISLLVASPTGSYLLVHALEIGYTNCAHKAELSVI